MEEGNADNTINKNSIGQQHSCIRSSASFEEHRCLKRSILCIGFRTQRDAFNCSTQREEVIKSLKEEYHQAKRLALFEETDEQFLYQLNAGACHRQLNDDERKELLNDND